MAKREAKRVAVKGKATTLPPTSKPPASKIVAGTGVVARSGTPGRGDVIQKAMEQAIVDAREEGINDDDEIRERMRAAAKDAGKKFDAAAAKAAAAKG